MQHQAGAARVGVLVGPGSAPGRRAARTGPSGPDCTAYALPRVDHAQRVSPRARRRSPASRAPRRADRASRTSSRSPPSAAARTRSDQRATGADEDVDAADRHGRPAGLVGQLDGDGRHPSPPAAPALARGAVSMSSRSSSPESSATTMTRHVVAATGLDAGRDQGLGAGLRVVVRRRRSRGSGRWSSSLDRPSEQMTKRSPACGGKTQMSGVGRDSRAHRAGDDVAQRVARRLLLGDQPGVDRARGPRSGRR